MASDPTLTRERTVILVRAQWTLLTEDDVHHGLRHRETLVERLCRRYGLDLEEARAQLQSFEEKYPGMAFERA